MRILVDFMRDCTFWQWLGMFLILTLPVGALVGSLEALSRFRLWSSTTQKVDKK